MKIIEANLGGLYVAFCMPHIWNGYTLLYVHGGPGSHSKDFEAGLTYFSAFKNSNYAFITYDQRGAGRSIYAQNGCKLTHKGNIKDLKFLINNVSDFFNLREQLILYGHSYGSRLVYDCLWSNPEINVSAILAGRSLHIYDSFNTSLGLDLLVLRSEQPSEFKKAVEIISEYKGEPYEISKRIRVLFKDLKKRQQERQKYYWANEEAMSWWNSTDNQCDVKDSDEAYFQIVSTISEEKFNPGVFDPNKLKQSSLFIIGFHDYLMNGTAYYNVDCQNKVVRFNGSAHYPHFEQPELFIETINKFIQEKVFKLNLKQPTDF